MSTYCEDRKGVCRNGIDHMSSTCAKKVFRPSSGIGEIPGSGVRCVFDSKLTYCKPSQKRLPLPQEILCLRRDFVNW